MHVIKPWLELLEKNCGFGPADAVQEDVEQIYQRGEALGLSVDELHAELAKAAKISWSDTLESVRPNREFVTRYPISLAREKSVLGLVSENPKKLLVALASYRSFSQLDVIQRYFDKPIETVFVPESILSQAINEAYEARESQTVEAIESLEAEDDLEALVMAVNREDLLDSQGRAPVIRLVNSIVFDAVKNRASDIHVQPYEEHLQVRFRIDGELFDQFQIPKATQEEVLSRIKVIGEMDIAEKRLPQDGRASVKIGDRTIDLRIASLPTSFGERIVIRLLDKSVQLYSLEELGMRSEVLSRFKKLIHREHGLLLVTGPTGSGKSTTLYASLQEINTKHQNVVTLEDPIEYQLHGISQTPINEKKGMTFATGLRNVLRQDPDIIMVGEIRDRETAEMAIQSAMTGHMVFSTLHTNDAASAINRLLDLGVEPYLVASSVVGVLAQRLVRKICPDCRSPQTNSSSYIGKGCSSCRQTGYLGRIGLFELMSMDDDLRGLVQNQADASQVRAVAQKNGMRLLKEDGEEKAKLGETTEDEVIRVSTDG